MTATGEVQSDLEKARDRLTGMAQKDHLTAAFNRHAFHALLDRDRGRQARQVQANTSQQDVQGRFSRRRQALALKPGEDKPIDGVGSPTW